MVESSDDEESSCASAIKKLTVLLFDFRQSGSISTDLRREGFRESAFESLVSARRPVFIQTQNNRSRHEAKKICFCGDNFFTYKLQPV